jgi:hypothetical protein
VLSIPTSSSFPWKSIWKVKTPPRVTFFVRMVVLRKILTLDSLRKMNIIVVEWCFMWKKSGKLIVVRELWSLLFHLFGFNWVMLRRLRELLVNGRG